LTIASGILAPSYTTFLYLKDTICILSIGSEEERQRRRKYTRKKTCGREFINGRESDMIG